MLFHVYEMALRHKVNLLGINLSDTGYTLRGFDYTAGKMTAREQLSVESRYSEEMTGSVNTSSMLCQILHG
jgi:hypothetical protein